VCGPTACKTSCESDTDCATTHYCTDGACTPLVSGLSSLATLSSNRLLSNEVFLQSGELLSEGGVSI